MTRDFRFFLCGAVPRLYAGTISHGHSEYVNGRPHKGCVFVHADNVEAMFLRAFFNDAPLYDRGVFLPVGGHAYVLNCTQRSSRAARHLYARWHGISPMLNLRDSVSMKEVKGVPSRVRQPCG
jgi:hypothetical protein